MRPLRPVAIAGGGGGRGGVAIPGRGSGRTRVEDLVASLVSRPLKPSSALRAARGPEETMGAAVTRDRCALLSLRALPSDWRRPYNTATRSTPVGEGLLCSPPLRGFLNHHALNILWPSILRAPQYAKSTLGPHPPFEGPSERPCGANLQELVDFAAAAALSGDGTTDATFIARRRGDGGGGALPRDDRRAFQAGSPRFAAGRARRKDAVLCAKKKVVE